jgi:predicted nuclease of predicted toxin-antitoxin system
MLLKLDENLPVRLKERLAALGYDVDTVMDEGLRGASDDDVWARSQIDGRFLVTQDLDFSDLRAFAPGTHHGILLVRLPEDEQWRAHEHIAAWMGSEEAKTWGGCLVVATLNRIRVRRPELQ